MQLSWNELISDQRYSTAHNVCRSPNRNGKPRSATRSAFEADYDRIIYSSAFRRLGQKTQVHPMETNAHIHNRLTHSLEVSSVSRTFARKLVNFLRARNELPCNCEKKCVGSCCQSAGDLNNILMAASLAHDIGNPPFGHAGEFAIRQWVADHLDRIFPAETERCAETTALKQDFLIFEGNAQGFRIAARDDIVRSGYLCLTGATLASMVKYPWGSTDPEAARKGKYCFFSSERAIAETIFETMGLRDGRQLIRHPLSFLTEAADDICYSVIDIEDAVEMQILGEKDARELYLNLLGKARKDYHVQMKISQLRAVVVGKLIEQFWQVFQENYVAVMAGEYHSDLKEGLPDEILAAFGDIKKTYDIIFGTAKKVRIEVGTYELLGRILDTFSEATRTYAAAPEFGKLSFKTKRTLAMAWDEPWLVENASRPYSWWLHEVLDFISSLTDEEAYTISNAIAGVGRI